VASLAAFAGVVEKWQAVLALQPLVSELRVRMTTEPSGSNFIYGPGMPLKLALSRTGTGSGKRYATVSNLAADGTVQLLYPLAADGEGVLPDGRQVSILETEVVPPFGVDHIVAVTSPGDMNAMRSALRSAAGQRAAGRLTGMICDQLRRDRGQGALAISQLSTGL
jgi:hypothetical protein